ncbi:MAG TPA: porin [Candidatus Polarisedimenticolia bacterium]|jgi:hypothetical protein|nr:porin [Candidatus Polarisedimenticolia bacterium]
MSPSKALVLALAALASLAPAFNQSVSAQVTPAAGYTGADDTPTVKVGGTIFTDYTYTDEPTTLDVDGNEIHPTAFDVKRAYLNVTGTLHHLIGFRITPDIVRETGSGGNVDGSLTFRLKYAYGQFNFDDAWSKGSWVRLGLQQTPYVDYAESVYRYRFQGPTFADAEKYITSSDFALSAHYNFPGNFGDLHAGYYNGDGYTKADPNDQKAIQIRATLRPVPNGGIIKGLRLTAFYDADHYASDDARTRLILNATFEHKYVNASVEHLDAKDQLTAAAPEIEGKGWSVWVVPKFTRTPQSRDGSPPPAAVGQWEMLLRWDRLKPDTDVEAEKERKIAGVAYWFAIQRPVAASLLLDYEEVTYDPLLAKPDEKRYALHALFNF